MMPPQGTNKRHIQGFRDLISSSQGLSMRGRQVKMTIVSARAAVTTYCVHWALPLNYSKRAKLSFSQQLSKISDSTPTPVFTDGKSRRPAFRNLLQVIKPSSSGSSGTGSQVHPVPKPGLTACVKLRGRHLSGSSSGCPDCGARRVAGVCQELLCIVSGSPLPGLD